jgi:hypothetical protein
MLCALDHHVVAEGGPEDVEFRPTEVLTRARSDTDRTMVLDEHEVAVVVDDLGEIALLRANACERFDARTQVAALGDRRAIGRQLVLRACIDDALQAVLAEGPADRVEEIDREIVVVVGKQVAREIGQRPDVRRPAPTDRWTRRARHQPGRGECVEVLADGRFGEPERAGELTGRRLRALQPVDEATLRVAQPCSRLGPRRRSRLGPGRGFGLGFRLDGRHRQAHYRKDLYA